FEFGICRDPNDSSELKAIGSGLLSSCSELEHSINNTEKHMEANISNILNTEKQFSQFQRHYFVFDDLNHVKQMFEELFED
ncbi:hypothetical protein GJ496_005991, partial [Pomphorhynchus laevis]